LNSNELAEKLLDCLGAEERWEIRSKSASMLRHQQIEIETLKERNLFLESFYRTVKAQAK
jgi:hypothetical protein